MLMHEYIACCLNITLGGAMISVLVFPVNYSVRKLVLGLGRSLLQLRAYKYRSCVHAEGIRWQE